MEKEVPVILLYALAFMAFGGGLFAAIAAIDIMRGWDWYSAQQSVQRICRWAREKLASRKAANR